MATDKNKGSIKEKRSAKVSLAVPFCIGNITQTLSKKSQAQGGASHSWLLYLRAPDNTDLSHVISKVSFTLHSSFAKSLRELTEPPYEVREEGWGEFDVAIKIDFADDAREAPLKLTHRLKLFHEDEKQRESNKKPVVKEVYDEIVFWEPCEEFYTRVKSTRSKKCPGTPDELFPKYRDQTEMGTLLAARQKIAQERANMVELIEGQGF